jgi:P-type conjugative transfer protein TrbJ
VETTTDEEVFTPEERKEVSTLGGKPMLRKALTRLILCACALAAAAPLALGTGFEYVYDGANHMTALGELQQQATSATQNVASVLKLVDQYALQMQQYRQQLLQYTQQMKDGALPVAQIWGQVQKTMGDMMNLVNQAQGSQMLAYLQQYKDLNGWLQSNGYYNPNTIQQGYALQKSTNDTALQMAQAQRAALLNDAQRFQALQGAAGSADGEDKLLSYANQIAAEQAQQLMQIRALANQMLEEGAARDAALANRQAMMDAATQKALANDTGGFENTRLPLDYSKIRK